MHSDACICFPANEQPDFGTEQEKARALGILCPMHGARFHASSPVVYRSAWLQDRAEWHSEQFHKALAATEEGNR